jgi:hypothetical protein
MVALRRLPHETAGSPLCGFSFFIRPPKARRAPGPCGYRLATDLGLPDEPDCREVAIQPLHID